MADEKGRVLAGRKRRRLIAGSSIAAVVVGLLPLTAAAGPAVAAAPVAATSAPATNGRCGAIERAATLAYEQVRVLRTLKDHLVLRTQADVEALAAPNPYTGAVYPIMPHFFTSTKGMGVGFVNPNPEITPGVPTLLFYRPARDAQNVLDPFGPDAPYTLVGWGYAGQYAPNAMPSFPNDPGLRCFDQRDWFVHETGIHDFATWQFYALPPEESWHGEAAVELPPIAAECAPTCPDGVGHPRLWDAHIWINPLVPKSSILNPGTLIPGFDPVVGVNFFYPERPASAVQPAKAKSGTGGHSGHGG